MYVIGNVIKFGDSVYIVSDTKEDKNGKLQTINLIPIDYSNSLTIVSREHPFMKKVFAQECKDGECNHVDCPYTKIPDPKQSIRSIKYLADNVADYVRKNIFKNFSSFSK